MHSKITDIIARKIPIIIKYRSGQTNVYENAINRADFNKKEVIEVALEKINKTQNYWPKNVKITTSILVEEE